MLNSPMNNRRELLRGTEETDCSPISRSDAWIDQELAACVFKDVRLGKRFRTLLQQHFEADSSLQTLARGHPVQICG